MTYKSLFKLLQTLGRVFMKDANKSHDLPFFLVGAWLLQQSLQGAAEAL